LLGVLEIGAAAMALAGSGFWLIPAFILYLGFLLFTIAAMRGRFSVQSCGCFGREETPPTWIHVTYNGLAVVSLGYLASVDLAPITRADDALLVVAYLGFGLLGAYLSYLLLAQLPATLSATRPG
jgi:Methylamine utilisation protein MauE